MISYRYIGVLLMALSICCLIVFLICIMMRKKRRPLYRGKLPKIQYPEGFAGAVLLAYEVTGDIRGMLQLLKSKWNGKAEKRIAASLDYLNHSRYRDYETALYKYLSDGSEQVEEALDQVLEKEIRKQKGLICRK